jgi:hypothetical protein
MWRACDHVRTWGKILAKHGSEASPYLGIGTCPGCAARAALSLPRLFSVIYHFGPWTDSPIKMRALDASKSEHRVVPALEG